MDNIIKYRYQNDLWYSEAFLSEALKWDVTLEMSLPGANFVICLINGVNVEVPTKDFHKLIDSKAFNTKFKINKHNF